NAILPPQPKAERIVPKAVFDAIDLAIKTSVETTGIEKAQLVARNYFCALPPISNLDEILDVALGVLRGRPEDMRKYEAYLNKMEVWNQRISPGPRRQLNAEQAAHLLSDDFLVDFSKRMRGAERRRPREEVVPTQSGMALLMAAMRIAVDDPIQLHRILGIVLEQFRGLKELSLLYSAALEALSGTQVERAFFLNTLNLMDDICEPDGLPAPISPRPSPFPYGNPFWPP